MKLKSIKKWCNSSVIGLGVISVVLLIKFCDLPNYLGIAFFEKPKGDWNILISILTSYVVTVGFYIIMNLIPDIIKEKEDEVHSLPYRCSMHRDVQLFLADILFMWSSVIKFAGEKDKELNVSDIDSVSKMFDKECIIRASSNVNLYEKSNAIDINRNKLIWKSVIDSELTRIESRGNKVLDKYSKDLPVDVHYSLEYLLGSCPLIGIMIHVASALAQNGDVNISLANCIASDEKGDIDLEKTIKSVNCIYDWVNEEYRKLDKIFDEEYPKEIYRVDIKTYFK